MKKHDEGYVLAFVMVVITVLCLIVVLLMPLSLRNLQAQNDSIRRMQDKYAAQGVIETVVAKMDSTDTVEIQKQVGLNNLESSLQLELLLENYWEVSEEDFSFKKITVNDGKIAGFSASVRIVGQYETATVVAILNWIAECEETDEAYVITPSGLEYESYQVSSNQGGGPDE